MQLLKPKENLIANRVNIAERFNTDELTTHRILMNCNYSFVARFLGGENPDNVWTEAHPFSYPAYDGRDYTSMSLDFIAAHFETFASQSFKTTAGWKFNEKTGKMEWKYGSFYEVEHIVFKS